MAFKYLKLTKHDEKGQQIDNKFVELGISFCFPWTGYFTAEVVTVTRPMLRRPILHAT